MVGGCRGYVVAGLTENKTKPPSWGLAELGNKLSWLWWVGGLINWPQYFDLTFLTDFFDYES